VFDGFTYSTLTVDDTTIRVCRGGSGPPLLLMHGHPETHVMWHAIADRLAQNFTVVATDLRGYGDSGKPIAPSDVARFSKRVMAADNIEVMRQLGYERFYVAGHDRGGRVAYRMALDHPECVIALAVMDIIPTADVWLLANRDFALGYWHWGFLAQPYDIPESLLTHEPEGVLNRFSPKTFAPEALAEYRRCLRIPGTLHAICQDYRAGATIDYEIDMEDRGKRRITMPLLVLWGGRAQVGKWYDVLDVWRPWAVDLRGHAIDAGHFLPEENPDATHAALHAFFTEMR
jgi:haloacetate dehalogenase